MSVVPKLFTPTVGSQVRCPPDRGDDGYVGKVEGVSDTVNQNRFGHPFVWTTVRHPRGHASVWPSNRLTH